MYVINHVFCTAPEGAAPAFGKTTPMLTYKLELQMFIVGGYETSSMLTHKGVSYIHVLATFGFVLHGERQAPGSMPQSGLYNEDGAICFLYNSFYAL
jgi:hypothetical protein